MTDEVTAAAANAAPATSKFDELVERWFQDSFNGGPVARSTECWNAVHAAKDELKRRLAKPD